jgi:hypothetical protein
MQPDVVFTVVFRRDGEFLAAPTVIGEFGRQGVQIVAECSHLGSPRGACVDMLDRA